MEVARLRSFSRAAEQLFRTQPAISAQVRLLEQECGEKLFDRSGKKVQLTPAGEILKGYAERLLALQKEALQAIAELNQTPRGQLHIGANEATCLYVLPKTFARFKQLYPLVQISIYRNFSHKILQKVQEGQVDLGISLLSRTYCEPEVAAGVLKLIPLDGEKLYRELGLIYRRDGYLSLPAKVFIDVVRESTQASNSASPSTTDSIS